MVRWIAIFEDQEEHITRPIREKHDALHFACLAAHKSEILLAGGLRPDDDAWDTGGLWLLDVKDAKAAKSLCESDPYFKLGLRKSYKLLRWGKAPCYGEVVL